MRISSSNIIEQSKNEDENGNCFNSSITISGKKTFLNKNVLLSIIKKKKKTFFDVRKFDLRVFKFVRKKNVIFSFSHSL